MAYELSVPTPQISSNYIGTNNFLKKREAPVIFTLGNVLKDDGSILLIEDVEKAYFYVFKEDLARTVRLWDKKNNNWGTIGDVQNEDREISPLEYVPESPTTPWKGNFLLLGEDKKYDETSPNGFPRYFIRCYFEYKVSESVLHTGESNRSIAMMLPELGADINVGLGIPGLKKELAAGLEFKSKKNPDWVNYFIKNNFGNVTANVQLEKNGVLTIKNSNAQITINSSGDINLSPKAGRKVIIRGEVEITGITTINGTIY